MTIKRQFIDNSKFLAKISWQNAEVRTQGTQKSNARDLAC